MPRYLSDLTMGPERRKLMRAERVQERLAKAGNDLVYTENVTVIDPAGRKPKRTEIRFAAATK
jgi:hypothetical protein